MATTGFASVSYVACQNSRSVLIAYRRLLKSIVFPKLVVDLGHYEDKHLD